MARELAPAGLRSSPKAIHHGVPGIAASAGFTTAAQPSGSKLPRHGDSVRSKEMRQKPLTQKPKPHPPWPQPSH
nr:hypothetical protein C1892_21725 [Pseudomonas sp. MPBD7-1]